MRVHGSGPASSAAGIAPHRRTARGGLALQVVDVAQGVGALLVGEVRRVDAALAAGLARVRLDQLAAEVEAHQSRGRRGRAAACRSTAWAASTARGPPAPGDRGRPSGRTRSGCHSGVVGAGSRCAGLHAREVLVRQALGGGVPAHAVLAARPLQRPLAGLLEASTGSRRESSRRACRAHFFRPAPCLAACARAPGRCGSRAPARTPGNVRWSSGSSGSAVCTMALVLSGISTWNTPP